MHHFRGVLWYDSLHTFSGNLSNHAGFSAFDGCINAPPPMEPFVPFPMEQTGF